MGAALLTAPGATWAQALPASPGEAATEVDRIVVFGYRKNLVGEAISASEGSVGQVEISSRPLLRTGDLLEFVPGLIATQHSGSGKANQYFLRGFNLDHGSDFSTSVDAMPVNMPTHGHGQGYTDLNFIIPETVEELTYRKGVYYADVGDFSSAGSARFHIADQLPQGVAEVTVGQDGYQRGVVADSAAVGPGALMYGLEVQRFDGPWTDIKEDVRKVAGVLRYSGEMGGGRGRITLMGYDNSWNSPDQIPQRAVAAGLISEFGSIDPTVGGQASRYSLSGGWNGPALGGQMRAEAYAVTSKLGLFSNFTYLLDDPVNGDQFEQVDDRQIYGFEVSQQWSAGANRWRVGVTGRYDDIDQVGLFRSRARMRLSPVRDDVVEEMTLGVFAANEHRFSDKLRTYVGLRYDQYDFEVRSQTLAANSGEADDGIGSVKLGVTYAPIGPLELYANYGQGFHSNDARGTTITIDPVTGDPADPVTPLVRSTGGEIGARVYLNDRLQATAALWTLSLDSELLFVGDAGNTEASRPSRRDGLELGLYYFASDNLSADVEVSYAESEFRDDDPAGAEIPGSIPLVISAGVSWRADSGWLASATVRRYGSYPLIEDDSVRSEGSTLMNLRTGREWSAFGFYIDVLNVFDSNDHDVDYFYASRLAGEPAGGVEDIHYHVFQPRSLRASLRYKF